MTRQASVDPGTAALHSQLRGAVRAYLSAGEPTSVGPTGSSGWTPDSWRAMANDLGVQGVSVAESSGGLGLGTAVEAIVHEEMGRVLYEGPYLSTVGVVLPMLTELGSDDLVERVAAGAAAFGSAAGMDAQWPALTGEVSGRIQLVRDADAPDGVVLPALVDGVAAIAWFGADDPGVRRIAVDTIDLTRPLWRLELEGARPQVLATGDSAVRAAQVAARHSALALCAESVGVAARAFELTVAYVASRRQFGRAIGSFQAIKHQCADLLVTLELARSALEIGLAPADDPAAATAIARIQCGRSAWEITETALHLHGGIGFTWEHRMHLYFRRAKTNQVLLADGTGQHDVIMAALADR